METYRLCILFPSGSELSETVDFAGLKTWVDKEKFGYRIIFCNGYKWKI